MPLLIPHAISLGVEVDGRKDEGATTCHDCAANLALLAIIRGISDEGALNEATQSTTEDTAHVGASDVRIAYSSPYSGWM